MQSLLLVRNIWKPHKTSREPLYLSLLQSVNSKGANIKVHPITKLNNPSDIWWKNQYQHGCSYYDVNASWQPHEIKKYGLANQWQSHTVHIVIDLSLFCLSLSLSLWFLCNSCWLNWEFWPVLFIPLTILGFLSCCIFTYLAWSRQ